MAIVFKNLVPGSQLTTATATYYTASNSTTGVIQNATVTNTSGGSQTYTAYIIIGGGSPSASNEVVAAKAVAAGTTDVCPELEGKVIEALGTLRMVASANGALTLMVSGIEVT